MSSSGRLVCSPFPSTKLRQTQTPASSQSSTPQGLLLTSLAPLAPLALALTLTSPWPSSAIPFPNSPLPSPLSPSSTPYSQSQTLQLGLENGKIRPCPSTNPGCVSTNPTSSSFSFPWVIPDNYEGNAVQRLREAILKTQRNVRFKIDEETQDGQYLQAEVDGAFGRDVMEFLVKRDFVAYRSMAMKITYVYPFTTALGDSKGQVERINRIREELGWYSPNFESMD